MWSHCPWRENWSQRGPWSQREGRERNRGSEVQVPMEERGRGRFAKTVLRHSHRQAAAVTGGPLLGVELFRGAQRRTSPRHLSPRAPGPLPGSQAPAGGGWGGQREGAALTI